MVNTLKFLAHTTVTRKPRKHQKQSYRKIALSDRAVDILEEVKRTNIRLELHTGDSDDFLGSIPGTATSYLTQI